MALLLQWLVLPAVADELGELRAALERASEQHRLALATLETSGQQETAAEVHRFRQTWQDVVERFGARRRATGAGDESTMAALLDIDVRIIGILLIIDLGNRDAARDTLLSIAVTLSDLKAAEPQ